jgi:uncharacterized protein YkwD
VDVALPDRLGYRAPVTRFALLAAFALMSLPTAGATVLRTGPGDAKVVSARVLKLVNDARSRPRRCGGEAFPAAKPLTLSPQLERAALLHSREMAMSSSVRHEGSDGSTPVQRAAQAGYTSTLVAENVAAGQETADQLMADWLVSAAHCANIMSAQYAEMGVAFAINEGDAYGVYWTLNLGAAR